MGFLGIVFTFLGYLLTYAALANHGRLASQPWMALFADAYDGSIIGQGKPKKTTTPTTPTTGTI